MSLAQRLLVAIGILTIVTTATLALGVRWAWRGAEASRFEEEFQLAFTRLEKQLGDQFEDLQANIAPLCAHDPIVDSALVGLRGGDLESRLLSISLRVPELSRALRLDELVLLTNSGRVLGAGPKKRASNNEAALARELAKGVAAVRRAGGVLALQAGCVRRDAADTKAWVGLYAAVHLEPLVERAGARYGLELHVVDETGAVAAEPAASAGRANGGSENESAEVSHVAQPPEGAELQLTRSLQGLGGVIVRAERSRTPLVRSLARLDTTVLFLGGATFIGALGLAMLMARGLARPIVAFTEQIRDVVHGVPEPIEVSGGRELEQAATAFNLTLQDLTRLRQRLAVTERIAARREIARQVAHEIKNPLAPIRAAVETLRRLRARQDAAFDDYFEEATRTVLDEVQRIAHIVGEFTRFERLPAPRPESLDLVETVSRVVRLHQNAGIPIELRAAACPRVNADRDQIIQVVTNLLQNALDAVAEVPNPQVWVELGPEPGQAVHLVVRDNGPGVPETLRPHLFEPYRTSKTAGTGLGLAIVERIVTEHGGEISYAERPGGGALFKAVFPTEGPASFSASNDHESPV